MGDQVGKALHGLESQHTSHSNCILVSTRRQCLKDPMQPDYQENTATSMRTTPTGLSPAASRETASVPESLSWEGNKSAQRYIQPTAQSMRNIMFCKCHLSSCITSNGHKLTSTAFAVTLLLGPEECNSFDYQRSILKHCSSF